MHKLPQLWQMVKQCKNKTICIRCSKEKCSGVCFKASIFLCTNCNGNHSNAYRGCPQYKKQLTLAKSKTELKTFAEVTKSTHNRINNLALRVEEQTKVQMTSKIDQNTTQNNSLNETIQKQQKEIENLKKEITHPEIEK